ncbi:MAG: vitamin K epoxide reductase family protein [Chloroflexota bacterium]
MSDSTIAGTAAVHNAPPIGRASTWAIGILLCVGLVAAGYLAYSSLTLTSPVCGGIGDCDAVQSSAYSHLLDIPVSVIGLAGYIAMAIAFLGLLILRGQTARLAHLGLTVFAVSGMVFSFYLTYVELFIIRAICPWCLTSAFVITVLALIAVDELWRWALAPTES